MYDVEWKDQDGDQCCREFPGLDAAMAWAKVVNVFVTIRGNGMEIVGIFGVDSIENGVCPDGVEYSWKKRRR